MNVPAFHLLPLAMLVGLTACQPPREDPAQAPAPSPIQTEPATASTPEPTDLAASAPAPVPDRVTLPPTEPQGKPLLMHYMPWYKTPEHRDSWGSHWTGHNREHNPDQLNDNGLPDIWSHHHPLIGLYDSTDPDVLECQLLQMKLAGVDGVLVDWYGIADTADHPEIHEATQALFDACQRLGMWFAACYEDRTIQLMVEWNHLKPEETTNHLTSVFQWMQDHWFEQPHYYRLNDRPLLLNFGPIYLDDPEIWNEAMKPLPIRPAFFALHHLWRKAGADGGFTWIHFEPWEPPTTPESIRRRLGEVFTWFTSDPNRAIVSAFPGYHDVYGPDTRRLDHRGGDTLRETLEVAMAGPWPLVQLVTWNDYGEGTVIEPTHEFGYTFLEIILEARKREQGEAMTSTPADLRLPARLLALRQNASMSSEALDVIALDLARGRHAEANRALAELEASLKP